MLVFIFRCLTSRWDQPAQPKQTVDIRQQIGGENAGHPVALSGVVSTAATGEVSQVVGSLTSWCLTAFWHGGQGLAGTNKDTFPYYHIYMGNMYTCYNQEQNVNMYML